MTELKVTPHRPVAVEPVGYIDEKDCVFDGGFKCTTPMVWGDPAANRIAVYTVPPAPAVQVDGEGWSGWATQYPGKIPVLRGAREIAELNYCPEEGQRLLFLTSTAHQPVDVEKPNLLLWQLRNQLQHLVRAGRYLADSIVETRGAQCMDDFDHELNQAEKLLATHPQLAAGLLRGRPVSTSEVRNG